MLTKLKTLMPPNPFPSIGQSIAKKVNTTPYLGKTVSYCGKTVYFIGNAASFASNTAFSIGGAIKTGAFSIGGAINNGAKAYTGLCETTVDLAEKTTNAAGNTLDVINTMASAAISPIAHPINTALWAHGINNLGDAYDVFQLKDQEVSLGMELTQVISDERTFSKRLQDAAPHLYLGATKAALAATLELGTISNAFVNQPMCSLEPDNLETAFNVWHEHSRELADYAWTKGSDVALEVLPVLRNTVTSVASDLYAQGLDFYANTTKQDVFNGLAKGFSNAQLGLQVGGIALGVAGFSYMSAYNFTKCAEAVETKSPLAFVKHGVLSAAGLAAAVATPFLLGADKLFVNASCNN